MIEIEEGIEALDAAIDYKNESIYSAREQLRQSTAGSQVSQSTAGSQVSQSTAGSQVRQSTAGSQVYRIIVPSIPLCVCTSISS